MTINWQGKKLSIIKIFKLFVSDNFKKVKKSNFFLLPNMIELFQTNRMIHFPGFAYINLILKIGYFILW